MKMLRLRPAALILLATLLLPLHALQATDRYDTWVQGDTVKLNEGETALIIFASQNCQVQMVRPGTRKPLTLKLEPTAKAIPVQRPRNNGGIRYNDEPALALVTSPRTPIAFVGPAILTLENSTGPKRDTCYVSVMITKTEFSSE